MTPFFIPRGPRLDTLGILHHVMTRGLERQQIIRSHIVWSGPGVSYLWIESLGHSGAPAARAVGIQPEGVHRVAERGRQQAKYWQQVLGR